MKVINSQTSWTVRLSGQDLDTGRITLPPEIMSLLTFETMRVRLSATLEIQDAVHTVSVGSHIDGVNWPLDFYPGMMLTVTWPHGAPTLYVSEHLSAMECSEECNPSNCQIQHAMEFAY